jgi:radical SAM protein (TIGR01212 family)
MIRQRTTFPWGDRRRINSYSARLREIYGGRIQKVSVNAGFTCPNRDGSKGVGGCLYCNNESFTPSYCVDNEDIFSQIEKGISFLEKRYKRIRHFIAYFQPYSNTYAPLEDLRRVYQKALKHPRIDGLAISTRPDCVNGEVLDYLKKLSMDHLIFLEYGIESCDNTTLNHLNRGHTFEETVEAVFQTAERGLPCTGHIIFGLPGETRKEMLEQAEKLSSLPLSALKFHQLQIIKNTPIADLYLKNPGLFQLFSLEDYILFIIKFLERLKPEISVDRLSSEAPPIHRIDRGWGNIRSDIVQKKIESVMEKQDTWQGKSLKNDYFF